MIGTTFKLGYDASAVTRGLSHLQTNAMRVGSSIKTGLQRMAIFGGVGAAAGGAASIGIVKNMIDITAEFERALALLKVVEGDGEKAAKSFEWIKEFAKDTPYELQDVLMAFAKLRGFGIDPMNGSLQTLGDTATSMTKSMNDIVEAMGDAVMGNNERLNEFLIKGSKDGSRISYSYVDKAGNQQKKIVGAAADAISQYIEQTVTLTDKAGRKIKEIEGDVSQEQIRLTLLAIFNEKYKGAMKEQAGSWFNMISNIKDAWSRFAYSIMMSGPFDAMKAKLKGILDAAEAMEKNGSLQKWATDIGAVMLKVGGAIEKVATYVYEKFFSGDPIAGLTSFFNDLAANVDKATEAIIGKGWDMGEKIGSGVVQKLNDGLGGAIINALNSINTFLFALAVELGKAIGGAIVAGAKEAAKGPAGGAIKAAGGAIAPIGKSLSDMWGGILFTSLNEQIRILQSIDRKSGYSVVV